MKKREWDVGSLVTVTYQREPVLQRGNPEFPSHDYVGRVVYHTQRGYTVRLEGVSWTTEVRADQVSAPPVLVALADIRQ